MKSQSRKILYTIIHPAIVLGLALNAFALDDRFDEPKPQENPKPKPQVDRADLVPIGVKLDFDHIAYGYRYYGATVTVGNFGKADAVPINGMFHCRINYKVLASTDPVNFPVGSKHSGGQCPIYFKGMGVMEIGDVGPYIFGTPDFALPVAVTSAEIFLVVDRWHYLSKDEDWENDSGIDYTGAVAESDEDNNVMLLTVMHFAELLDAPTTEPVVVRPDLKVRGK